jgi:Uroporphyrinogen decarboxylase (URO-D)
MSDDSTPRRMVKAWLKGEPPSRPLLMPILFSLGARMENLSPKNFQSNPTKIANALRQIRSVFEVDGLVCYFDPRLEIEALGPRQADGSWVTPDSFEDKGFIPVACDVLRRTKAMLKDEPALIIPVSGPIRLARQLCGGDAGGSIAGSPQEVIQFAAEVTASVARTFAEAGADLIMFAEDFADGLPLTGFEAYASLLAPVVNIVRFYEALPVLLLGKVAERTLDSVKANLEDCVLCPTWTGEKGASKLAPHQPPRGMAYALPMEAFCQGPQQFARQVIAQGEPSAPKVWLLTSTEDVTAGLDLKQLAEGLKRLRKYLSCPPDGGQGLPHQGGSDYD